MKYLGLDVGTTGVKAAVFDDFGIMHGYGFQSYPIQFGPNQCAEQDALLVWERAKQAIRAATQAAGDDIAAISLSVQGDAVIPIGRDGLPLHSFLLGMDYRSAPQAEHCADHFGAEFLFSHTGMRPHPMNSLTKIMWFAQERPQLHEAAAKYMTYADFFLQQLGADAPAIDLSMASRTMALDLRTRSWSEELLNFANCPVEKLSQPCPPGTVVGHMGARLADELKIRPGAAIVAGGHDQTCAALGAGLVADDGIALNSHGTAEVLSAAFDSPRLNRRMFEGNYPCTLYAQPGRYFTFALNHTGGVLLQWFRDGFCEKEIAHARELQIDPYTHLIAQAPMHRPSSVMALPHFNGRATPHCDLDARGAFVGLTMNTTRAELTKAIMDALAYEMKLNMEALRAANVPIRKLRCVGGAARSEAWLQLKADIMGVEVETLQTRESACLGAAMLAAAGIGTFRDLTQAAQSMVRADRQFVPDPKRSPLYIEHYALYKQLCADLERFNHSFTRIQTISDREEK